MLVSSCMVPFGEDVVVLAALRLRLSVFSWIDADAGAGGFVTLATLLNVTASEIDMGTWTV